MAKYLTVDETAAMFRVKRQTIYKWICERKIPSVIAGGRTLFDEAELVAWAQSGHRNAFPGSL